PAQSKHFLPVKVADRPFASTIPTCRSCRSASSRPMIERTSCGVAPSSKSWSPFVPKSELEKDWVATAPTPAFAYGTATRTLGNFDCTATPRSPLEGSRATMEKVDTRGQPGLGTRNSGLGSFDVVEVNAARTAAAAEPMSLSIGASGIDAIV